MAAGEKQPERRELFRMGINCAVRLTGLGDEREVHGRLLDLSGSGLAIECDEGFALGDRFRVKVVPARPIFMPLVADVEVARVGQGSEGTTLYGLKIITLLS